MVRGEGNPEWLEAELGRRYDVPVKYVIPSHDHEDHIIPGHAEPTTQQGFLDFRDYVVALRDRVLNEMVQGASIEQIIERVTMDEFADYLNMASWRRTNIISMWDNMYRWREPNYDDSPGNYQSLYPVGYPIGEFGLPE